MITIKSVDEVYMKVLCDDNEVSHMIKDHFSFYARNYRHMPLYKFGDWDGKISLYNTNDRTMYKGLLHELLSFLSDSSIEYKFDDISKFKTSLKYDPSWIENTFKHMGRFEPKDYQLEYFKQSILNNKALTLSPTGSGKSYIIYMIVRYILDKTDWKILINVPSVSLCEQLLSDFKEYTIDNWNVDASVSLVYSDSKHIVDNANVVISTWQSTSNQSSEYISDFKAYICDEAHTASADNLTKIINSLVESPVRVGLTGTLDGTHLHTLEMIGRFGKIVKVVTTAQLIERGDLADVRIDCLTLQYPDVVRRAMTKKNVEYKDEIDYIINNTTRNRVIENIALKQNKNTLLLFNNVETHGKVMYSSVINRADSKLKMVHMVHGKVSGDVRESIRNTVESVVPTWKDLYIGEHYVRVRSTDNLYKMEVGQKLTKNDVDILFERVGVHHNIVDKDTFNGVITKIIEHQGSHVIIASYGTYAVGINIKNLHYLVFAHPLKKQIRLLQSIGRLLRTCKGKETVVVIDIVDDMSLNMKSTKKLNFAYKHFIERLKVYENTELPYTINNLNIN